MANTHFTLFNGDVMIMQVTNITLEETGIADKVKGTLSFTLRSRGIKFWPEPKPVGSLAEGQIQLALDTNIQTGSPRAFMTGSESADLILNLPVRIKGDKRDLSSFRKGERKAKAKK